MKRVSLEKVEAALKRAAFVAVHGTIEEHSGRFVPHSAARLAEIDAQMADMSERFRETDGEIDVALKP